MYYLCLFDFPNAEDDLDEELSESLLLEELLPLEAELPEPTDLPDEVLPEDLVVFPDDFEGEPDEKDSFPEP